MYSVKEEKAECIIVHSSDTDVFVLCIYYFSTLLQDQPELWIRVGPDNYLPAHELNLWDLVSVEYCHLFTV